MNKIYLYFVNKHLSNWALLGLYLKQALDFTCLQCKASENTEEKGEIAHNEQFLHVPQCFLTVWKTFYHFHEI